MSFYYHFKYYIRLSNECTYFNLDYDKYLINKMINMLLLKLVNGTIYLISVVNKLFSLIDLKLQINIC